MSLTKPAWCSCALLVIWLATPAVSAQEQSQPPIKIEADRADVDASKGISVYEGEAIMTHGEMRIGGERMEIHTSDNGEISHIIVTGDPAHYRDLPQRATQEIRAEAGRMEYYAKGPERALFFDHARMWQGNDSLSGDFIRINLKTQSMTAEGKAGQRARATIYPGQREEN